MQVIMVKSWGVVCALVLYHVVAVRSFVNKTKIKLREVHLGEFLSGLLYTEYANMYLTIPQLLLSY